MENSNLLKDLIIILSAVLPTSFLFYRLKLSPIMGYIIVGVLIGPHGIGLIHKYSDIEHLAEIGVVLLLFSVGLEFSLVRLKQNFKAVVLSGFTQVTLTIVTVAFLLFVFYDIKISNSIFYGFLVALSSTALVLKMYVDRREIEAPNGRAAVGILLFQDIAVLPMMLLIPILSSTSGDTSSQGLFLNLLKTFLFLVCIIYVARKFIPKILRQVIKLRSRETLILLIVLLCMGIAWITQSIGLSLAMGAFIAGIIISESEYSHQVVGEIIPFRDFFSSIFFISIGMLLQLEYFLSHWYLVLFITFCILLIKTAVTFISIYAVRGSSRYSMMAALGLAHIGEFSFVMAGEGFKVDLLDKVSYQLFLSSAVISMLLAPLCILISTKLSNFFSSLYPDDEKHWTEHDDELTSHAIIVGYGLSGQNLTRVLKETRVPFIVVDVNSDKVRQGINAKIPIMYGDITRQNIMLRAGIKRAKIIVFATSDLLSTRRSVSISRHINPDIFILARTRRSVEVDELKRLGANQVIPMEFETSIEIFSRVLKEYNTPNNMINQYVELIRTEGYGMFRGLSLVGDGMREFYSYVLKNTTSNHLVVEDSVADNKSLSEINLRRKTGAMILTVIRGKVPYSNPDPDFKIASGDLLVILGNHAQLDAAGKFLSLVEVDSPVV